MQMYGPWHTHAHCGTHVSFTNWDPGDYTTTGCLQQILEQFSTFFNKHMKLKAVGIPKVATRLDETTWMSASIIEESKLTTSGHH